MKPHRPHQLLALAVGDDPNAWEQAGFTVDNGSTRVGNTTIHLAGIGAERGVVGWAVDGLTKPLDGLVPSTPGPAGSSASHQNGIISIDHLVIGTDDFARTLPIYEQAGMSVRRTRTFEVDGVIRQQSFFWLGDVILELIGPQDRDPDGSGRSRFWGLAMTSVDLDQTAGLLGDRISEPKPALQAGRRISTLRTRELDISVPIAVMSPHVPPG
ncbi:MAG: VOC family protein [Acidimicrobiales bacterium]